MGRIAICPWEVLADKEKFLFQTFYFKMQENISNHDVNKYAKCCKRFTGGWVKTQEKIKLCSGLT